MTWPAVVFWALFAAGFFAEGATLLYLFFGSVAFGSLQMVPIDANVLPQVVASAFLVGKALVPRGNLVRLMASAVDINRAGLFSLYALYSVFTAFIGPRLFSGIVDVVPVADKLGGATLLSPSSGNVTQLGYLAVSYAVLLSFSVMTRPSFYRAYLIGTLILGSVFVITGVLDYLSFYGGAGLLDSFRTTSYNLLTDVESAGTKRLVGLEPEASVYGGSCAGLAALLLLARPCFERPKTRVVVLSTALLLMATAVLSTSSTAYLGLGVTALVYALNGMATRFAFNRRMELFWELFVFTGLAVAIVTAIVFIPSLRDAFDRIIETTIVNKATSQSALQRGTWTRVGWEAFLGTGGVGVGYGSVRTSNWFVSVLSSNGLFGGLLMFAFLAVVLFKTPATRDPTRRGMIRALRLGLVPINAMYFFGGTIPDIGVWVASLYGILLSLINRSDAAVPVQPAPVVRGRAPTIAAQPVAQEG